MRCIRHDNKRRSCSDRVTKYRQAKSDELLTFQLLSCTRRESDFVR